jgi:4-hydroxy-4-methyl-2-oxoglutarate aldolase
MDGTKQIDVETIIQRYLKFYSGLVFDQLDELGLGNNVLANDIKPIRNDMKLVGPAFTARGEQSPDSTPGHNQVQLDMFARFEPHSIEVIECGGDRTSAHFGELNATACLARKIRGTVIDGGTRDSAKLLTMNYPIFCAFQNPVAATGRWKVVEYQRPIELPGALQPKVKISPGDFIFGDLDGVVVVPKELIVEVMNRCEEHLNIEDNARAELADGQQVTDVFKRYGKF